MGGAEDHRLRCDGSGDAYCCAAFAAVRPSFDVGPVWELRDSVSEPLVDLVGSRLIAFPLGVA